MKLAKGYVGGRGRLYRSAVEPSNGGWYLRTVIGASKNGRFAACGSSASAPQPS
jgi:hypothetical protein